MPANWSGNDTVELTESYGSLQLEKFNSDGSWVLRPLLSDNLKRGRIGEGPYRKVSDDERTRLIEPRPQRLMDGSGHGLEFPPLAECLVAHLSERDPDSVKHTKSLTKLQERSRVHIVDFDKRSPLFIAEDTTDPCVPDFCPRREYTEVYISTPSVEGEKYFEMSRNCCGDTVTVRNGRGSVIGQVTRNDNCMKLRILLRDSKRRYIYEVRTNRFGFERWIGKLPCCRRVNFDVFDVRTGLEVAKITNGWTGFCKEYLGDVDDYFLYFGQVRLLEERILLVAATLFIDALYFSKLIRSWRNLIISGILFYYAYYKYYVLSTATSVPASQTEPSFHNTVPPVD